MRIRIAVAALLAGIAGGAGAADWRVEPRVDLEYVTDDNNRLASNPANEIDVSGVELDARLDMIARTPRSEFRLTPRLRATEYPDEPDDEITDGYLQLRWKYLSERSQAGLDLDYAHRTVLGRYLSESLNPDDGGLGDPDPGTGSGRTTDPTDQDEFRVKPRFSFDLTERTAMVLQLGYQDVQFDDQEFNERTNFTNTNATVGMRFRTSPTATLGLNAGVSRYEPETNFDSDAQSVNLEWRNAISETSQFYLRGGARRVRSEDALDTSWNSGFSGGAGVQWKFEVTELFLDYNHYVDPSAAGLVVDRDQLRFEWRRALSERSNLRFAARAIRDGKITGEDPTFEEREYLAAGAGYEWRFTRQFSLIAGYEYTWREYEDEPNDAASNRFSLGVSYQPDRR